MLVNARGAFLLPVAEKASSMILRRSGPHTVAARLGPPAHMACWPAVKRCAPAVAAATKITPVAEASQRRRRTAGSCSSAASSTVIEAKRSLGLVESPRRRIFRIQPGTRASGGGSVMVPATTLAMSASALSPANGRRT